MKPLAIDLFCGLGGWCDGFLAEGYSVVGFDIEARPYPGSLALQDVRTIHGFQFKHAACIVASPPCTEYSYFAMPWSRGKQIAAALRGECGFPNGYDGSQSLSQLNALFDACFRIQREASEAAGHHIPMVVENVKGAQPWVGKARANFGSFYLWGDVDSIGGRIVKRGEVRWGAPSVKAAARMMKMGRAPVAPNGVTRRLTNAAEWQEGDIHEYGGPAISLSGSSLAQSVEQAADLPFGKSDHAIRQVTLPWISCESPCRDSVTGNGEESKNNWAGTENDGRKVPGFNFHEHEKTGQPGRSFQSAAVAGKIVGSSYCRYLYIRV